MEEESEESEEVESSKMKLPIWKFLRLMIPMGIQQLIQVEEDVLEKVMAEHGIEDRDAFIAHAVKFDHDNNMYLKKVELTDAAKSFVEQSSEDSEDSKQMILQNRGFRRGSRWLR